MYLYLSLNLTCAFINAPSNGLIVLINAHQVEYLLEHGADVNRGLKSSSLHYAACFGRPNIVKLLLQYGADPDLRDEDGHTPLEKAQERGDEWHRQVIEILQNPS